MFDTNNDITVKSTTFNPLTEHKSEILSRLDPNTVIGDKSIGGNINNVQDKLKVLQNYSDLKKVQKNANKYFKDDVTVYVSTNKNKKYMVKNPTNNKYVHFGELGFEDFTKHKDKKRQNDYLSRATKIKGNWKSNRFSPNNLSINLLWQ